MPSYPGFGIMHPYGNFGMQMPCPPAFPMPPIAASQDFSPRQQFFRGGRGRRQKSEMSFLKENKKLRFDPDVPEWELSAGFDPEKALGRGFSEFSWVNAIGEITQPSSHITSAEEVARGESFDFDQLVFRDPNNFLAGSLSNNLAGWEEIDTPSEQLGWIKDGVDIHNDKSGYDHILLHPHSKMYFGLQFGGWFMVYNSIPFGFKASAFIYHTTGLVAMSYCRSLGVPGLLYIDDRLVPEWKGDSTDKAEPLLFGP
ncbi:Hypothetical predicted protein [Mytilus galloprovincialis]|uniref:Uncharacterized protein n=1 Tax=Mytilus galloprovincialis TaxID=29158 RepID=A0A8B6BH91_MYTGA|nr:Hypothetical predicted protein [Mytilus galloprovincialis]